MESIQKKYVLTPGIRLRREAFGGTFYEHKTGKITFLYHTEVMDILEQRRTEPVTKELSGLLKLLQEKGLIQELI